ncbi:MAG: hypothetical protein JNG90_19890, partial [Planctomycetaceae bacterium]|nr:hypothetical protein [Planctomycetaceae bacterium]
MATRTTRLALHTGGEAELHAAIREFMSPEAIAAVVAYLSPAAVRPG